MNFADWLLLKFVVTGMDDRWSLNEKSRGRESSIHVFGVDMGDAEGLLLVYYVVTLLVFAGRLR